MRFLAACVLIGCSGTIEVERVLTPKDASQPSKLHAVAIARGNETIPLPEGASISGNQVKLGRSNVYTHKLGENDVIETDDEGNIIAVRTPSERIEFKPKTAQSPEGADYVKGELASSEEGKTMRLERNDRIIVKGILSPGDEVPGGGRVVLARSSGALIVGAFSFALAYIPAMIGGVVSNEDRPLVAPIGGPWANLVARPACVIDPLIGANCIPDTLARFGSVMSGIFQAVGLVFLIAGIPSHAELREPSEEKPNDNERVMRKMPRLVLMPGGAGVSWQF